MTTTILVVDDSASVRQQVVVALAGAGFTVEEAEDGMEALEKVRKGRYAAVICDVNMPRMGGLDLLDALRREPAAGFPPILMLTTEGQPEMMRRAKAAGAKGWIVKPFKPHLLVSALEKVTKPSPGSP